MSTLRLRVDLASYDTEAAEGIDVIAHVYSLSGTGSHRNVVVPASADPTVTRDVDVEPGDYLVEGLLPSGRMVTEEIELADGETATVNLDATDSPHESHSVQFLVGNVGSARQGSVGSPALGDEYSSFFDSFGGVDRLGHFPAPDWPPGVSRVLQRWDATGGGLSSWDHPTTRDVVGVEDVLAALGTFGTTPIPGPTVAGDLPIYRFPDLDPFLPEPVDTSDREWVMVEDPSTIWLATLPRRWASGGSLAPAPVEVLVAPGSAPSPVAVTVHDNRLGAGLGYLGNGALANAAIVLDRAPELLYSKLTNPLAAAAGAYVLVGSELAGKDVREREWHSWLENLRDWFPWISDGMVLWALWSLRRARSEADAFEARRALLDACGRGVPYYAIGLTWLINGLAEFPEDPDCREALNQVRRISRHIDTRQPFVVLRFPRLRR